MYRLYALRHAHKQVNCNDQRLKCKNPEWSLSGQNKAVASVAGERPVRESCSLQSNSCWYSYQTAHSSLLHQLTKMVFSLADNLSSLRLLSETCEALNCGGSVQSVSLTKGFLLA